LILIITACASTPTTATPLPATFTVSPTQTSQPTATLAPADVFAEVATGRIPVIYSHGGGPCDIGGMVFFNMHPQADLIGLVLSRGEFYPRQAVNTWPVFLFDVLGSKGTAVGIGTETPLDPNPHEFPESWRGPSSNFWNHELPPKSTDFETSVGHELIIDLVNSSPDKVTIVAMGSMTDVALALQQDPGIIGNIAQVVIMGGAFTVPGNLSDGPEPTNNTTAEWNMYIDATAAKVILDSGVPVSIVPLDAVQYLVNASDVNQIKTIADPGVEYVARMWEEQYGWGGDFLIWDTITATAATNPENFYWTVDGVDVITEPGDFQGRTVPLHNGAQHIRYATGADYAAIMDLLFATFRGEEQVAQSPSEGSPIIELGGTWEGDTTGNFRIIFDLAPQCELGEICGTFEIPDFSLTGDVTFVSVDGNVYEFRATNISSGQPGNEYEYLQLLEDGTLKYHTEGGGTINEGILNLK
jgi:inosine-uridine nucleoside N-ribohydrolase